MLIYWVYVIITVLDVNNSYIIMSNTQKKKQIDEIMSKHKIKMADIKNTSDLLVSNFLEVLKMKQIEKIKNSI